MVRFYGMESDASVEATGFSPLASKESDLLIER